ncbi:HWE histidine kinase domain-containing protein [Pseudomonas sp. NPDC098747]|uniref:HWE histidine kinase domain-containing protein n=1 Tax=Pseudomonas sp. NPDC098747 TaxID=3364487 RepID=UPI00383B44EB
MSEVQQKSEKQEDAEAAVDDFRKDLGPFVVAAETTRMAMLFTDAKAPGDPIVYANDSFLKLTGYDRNEVLGQSFNSLLEQRVDPEVIEKIKSEFEKCENHDNNLDIDYNRKDGSALFVSVFISPVWDESGEIVQHFVSFMDITKHKEAQNKSKMFIDELNHRVKNTLATVQAIVWQSFKKSSDTQIVRESIDSRLFALSRSHDLLTREHWNGVSFRDLVNEVLEPFGVAGDGAARFIIAGRNVRISPQTALALGVALNELATNALKYGALSNEAGCVLIEWAVAPMPAGNRLIIRWQEKDGPTVAPPSRKGFGSQVIERGLCHELAGTVHLDFPEAGAVCMIDIPAPERAHVE